MSNTPFNLFDFTEKTDKKSWQIVDDRVMGGRSEGSFEIHKEGYGVFKGDVSLENNGGFSSLRHAFKPLKTSSYSKVVLYLKGDGKRYQFRIKEKQSDYYSYIQYFETDGKWQQIEIPFEKFYPSFRSRKLDQSNFSGEVMEEIRFLIANKNAEHFRLEIDKIVLE